MRVKVTIFVLSTFLLWTSLSIGSHHSGYSNPHEIKKAGEFTCKAIVKDKDFILKKALSQIATAPLNFAIAEISLWVEPRVSASYIIHRSVKYYLLFRVLRN